MANWISIKDAAKKYDTTEEKIHYLIRYRYLTFSYVDDTKLGGEYRDKLLMIDADEFNETLDFNTVAALGMSSEEKPIVRVPLEELNALLNINDDFREMNKALCKEIRMQKAKIKRHKIVIIIFILILSLYLGISMFSR